MQPTLEILDQETQKSVKSSLTHSQLMTILKQEMLFRLSIAGVDTKDFEAPENKAQHQQIQKKGSMKLQLQISASVPTLSDSSTFLFVQSTFRGQPLVLRVSSLQVNSTLSSALSSRRNSSLGIPSNSDIGEKEAQQSYLCRFEDVAEIVQYSKENLHILFSKFIAKQERTVKLNAAAFFVQHVKYQFDPSRSLYSERLGKIISRLRRRSKGANSESCLTQK